MTQTLLWRNPGWGCQFFCAYTQGSRCATTLGFEAERRWRSHRMHQEGIWDNPVGDSTPQGVAAGSTSPRLQMHESGSAAAVGLAGQGEGEHIRMLAQERMHRLTELADAFAV